MATEYRQGLDRAGSHYEELHSDPSPPRRSGTKRSASGAAQSERLADHRKVQSSALSPTRDPVKSVRIWQKHQLLSAFSKAQESEKMLEILQAKESKHQQAKGQLSDDSSKTEENRQTTTQKWAEKLKKYKRDERTRRGEMVKKGDQSLQELEQRVARLRSQKLEETRVREAANRSRMQIVKAHLQRKEKNEDQEMVDRMKRYQSRMEKSERCHSQVLKSRSMTAASRRQQHADAVSEDEDITRLLEFFKKHQERETKLEHYRKEQNKSAEEQRKSREDRWLRVAKNKKDSQRKNDTRRKELEKRHADSVSAVESRHQSVMKETFYRGEQHREREDHNQHNLNRLKRIQSARQAQILQRSVEEARRVESLKQSRRYHIEKYEEVLHSSLIERDRTYELVEIISKSPHSKRVQKVMKELSDSSL